MLKNVCILDYGSGNVASVFNLLNYLKISTEISNKENVIKKSTHLILPGVGSFGSVMEKIFLGICVGMQILAEYGFEFKKNNGLGWIDGKVTMIKSGKYPLPHIGWNNVDIVQPNKVMKGLEEI